MDCVQFLFLSVQYINNRLPENERKKIALHIADCTGCKNELALMYQLKTIAENMKGNIDETIHTSAFDKLPEKANELERIIETCSPMLPFEIIEYAMDTIRQMIIIIRQCIKLAVST